MRIAFLGNFTVPYCSEVHYLKTLTKLGHDVVPLQETQTTASDLVKVLDSGIDMFFWVHTHGWVTPQIEDFLTMLKVRGIPSVGYHLDLWLGIQREKDLETDPYWKIQYFFSVDKLMVDLLNSREDMPKAFFLRAGVFEDECFLGKKREEFTHDVIFVGSRGYHPEWPYRPRLIKWLEKTYGDRFAQYGGGGLGTVRGNDLNDLYASAKIVVGDTLCKGYEYPEYLSDRIFETTGRGGFMIHPYITGIENCFKIGSKLPGGRAIKPDTQEIAVYKFRDFTYLKYLIDYFLKNEDEREAIRLKGHERTKSEHTYTNRLKEIIQTIENEKNVNKQ